MPTSRSAKSPTEQLLGEIETRVVGMQYYENVAAPGEQANLEREPENPHDAHAIRVENGLFEPIGHISRRMCSWLAPLIDSGKVRVDACVPQNTPDSEDRDPSTSPLTLSIFLCKKGKGLLAKREVHTKLDALHDIVHRTYEEVQNYTSADLILELVEGLRPLARQELLPETRLLLALMPGVAREVRANKAIEAMAAIQELLGKITIGEPLHHHNLTVFPLSWPKSQEPPYVLFGRAIERREAAVEEVDEEGDVPNLGVTNNGQRPILIPEGGILVGAKQNRVVNVTVLVAAHSKFTVPVSCVERGRWRYQSQHFRSAFCAPPSLRSKKMRAIHKNRASRGTAESNQGEVWDEVAKGLDDLKAHSPTDSLTDGFEAAKEKLQQYRNELPLPSGAAGVLMARGDRVVGMDLFDSPDTLQSLWERLSDAYFFDALRNRRRRRKASRKSAQQFLQEIAARVKPRVPALGLGDELEIAGDEVVGGALLYSGRVCHLAAFTEAP
jgi:hypothetical protein